MTPLFAIETYGAAFTIKVAGKSPHSESPATPTSSQCGWHAVHAAEEFATVGQSEFSEIGSGSEKSSAIESVTVGVEWSETDIGSEAGQVDIFVNIVWSRCLRRGW